MKKIMTLLFSIGLLLGLTSCGGGAPDIFTVSFETEYGTAPESISVEDGTILTAEQLKALTCEGYTFLGWFDGETEAKADEYTVTKDVTLTAKWEIVPPPAPTKYTVTFKSEYGKAPETITVEEGTVLNAEQLKALTAENYIFKGWFDGETEAKAGEYKVTKDVTLTAKWEFKFLGIYDCFTLPNSIQVRITLNEDKTCALDLLLQNANPMANVTFIGTYTVEDALVKIDLDKEKLSLTSGITWEDFNTFDWNGDIGVTLEQVEEYFTKAKAGCVKIGKDRLIFTDQGYDFDFVPGKDFDERLIGAWEAKSGDISLRVLFNEDKSFVLGRKDVKGVKYAKGKYLTLQNYIKVIEVEGSYDNISYTPASEVLPEIMVYSVVNDVLTYGGPFNKMSTTDITFE